MRTQEEIREAIEHRDVLLALRAILATPSGKNFFKYLFKHLEVTELPPVGLEGSLLMDKIGFLRAGNSIYKLVSEADPSIAGSLIAQNEKEKYAQLEAETQI